LHACVSPAEEAAHKFSNATVKHGKLSPVLKQMVGLSPNELLKSLFLETWQELTASCALASVPEINWNKAGPLVIQLLDTM